MSIPRSPTRIVVVILLAAAACLPTVAAVPVATDGHRVDATLGPFTAWLTAGLEVGASLPELGVHETASVRSVARDPVGYASMSRDLDAVYASLFPESGASPDEASSQPEESAAAEPEEASDEPAPAYPACGPSPTSALAPLGILPKLCIPIPDLPAPLLAPLDLAPLLPSAAPTTRTSGAPDESVATASASAPAPAPAEGDMLVAVAGILAVAAASGAAPLAPMLWERLRRFALVAVLYTRLTKERALTHESREAIHRVLVARPGTAIRDLAEATGIARNTATHHLHMLEKQGLVSSLRKGRVRLYFPTGSAVERRSADALAALRHETTSAVARAIAAAPGLDQGSLCTSTGVTPSLAHWHVSRLIQVGLVQQVRDGRRVRYYPGDAYHRVLGTGSA